MKKQLGLILCLLAMSCFVFAQEKTPEAKARLKTESMSNTLQLNPTQVNALSTLHLAVYKKLGEAEKTCKGDKDCYKKKKKALKQEREAAYKKILTVAQFKQYLLLEANEDLEKEKNKKEKSSSTKK
ncbi:MAG: hypothetical protein FGM54_09400 [Chitinophagaceae bacterium]|nr:hypothetical protein [Chitinophagaceae bacterium]